MASAYQRKESRGLHYNADFPELAEELSSTVISDSFRRRYAGISLKQGQPAPGASPLVPAASGNILQWAPALPSGGGEIYRSPMVPWTDVFKVA